MSEDRLFANLSLGHNHLSHRVVLAPVTRYRADDDHVPTDLMRDYYAQRASCPGTLLITEATVVSPRALGDENVPGIWNKKQIAAWRKVTEAVHQRKCSIFLQLWALGRRSNAELLLRAEGGPYPVVGPSAIAVVSGQEPPHALSEKEIDAFINDFASAAKNAMQAGFDGVEVHGANGYLPDQFLQESCNQRNDKYGGSIQNRSRFVLELTQAIIAAVGSSKRAAVRLSPWSHAGLSNGIMNDPVPQFLHVISGLKELNLAYLHLVESRYAGDPATASHHVLTQRNDPFLKVWGPYIPIILAGGFTSETAKKAVNEVYRNFNVCVAFGRFYISTPDLPFRIKQRLELNAYDRASFYLKMSPKGYVDYPFSDEYLALHEWDQGGLQAWKQ
jgi:NADPH2 dehydrogenase